MRSYGPRLFRSVLDLALASDDRVTVLDGDSYVHMFSEHGDHLSKFKLSTEFRPNSGITFHHSSQHVLNANALSNGNTHVFPYFTIAVNFRTRFFDDECQRLKFQLR